MQSHGFCITVGTWNCFIFNSEKPRFSPYVLLGQGTQAAEAVPGSHGSSPSALSCWVCVPHLGVSWEDKALTFHGSRSCKCWYRGCSGCHRRLELFRTQRRLWLFPPWALNFLSGQPLSRTRAPIRSMITLYIVLTKFSVKSAVKIYSLEYLPDRRPDPPVQIHCSLN